MAENKTSNALVCGGRLRTRLFAGRCVLELPGAVGSDRRHFDLTAAQGGKPGLRQKLSGGWLLRPWTEAPAPGSSR